MVQDLDSDSGLDLGVLQIMRNHFEIERMTSSAMPIPIPIRHYDIGQQKTCKSGEWAAGSVRLSNNKTAWDKRKTNKTKVSPIALDHLLFTFLC